MAAKAEAQGVTGGSIEEENQLLQAFTCISSVDRVWCVDQQKDGGKDLMVVMSQRNVQANSMRKFVSHCHVMEGLEGGNEPKVHWSPFPLEVSGAALTVPSPSGTRMLVVRNGETKNGSQGPTKFEIWGQGRLLKEIFVPSSTHTSVYNDGWFEGVDWSSDEAYIAYVAEEPSPPKVTYGGSRSADSSGAGSEKGESGSGSRDAPAKGESDAGTWKGQGEWKEDWGERYTGKGRSVLFVLEIASGKVLRVEGLAEDVSAGQVIWAPPSSDGGASQLVFVGWNAYAENFRTAKRLGMIYCYNRPCALYSVQAPTFASNAESEVVSDAATTKKEAVKLTTSISSALSPRFTPDGKTLVFLSAHAAVDSGAHNATNSLHALTWPTNALTPGVEFELRTVVDVKQRADGVGEFPGLYASGLKRSPWLEDGRSLLLSTSWRSTQRIVAVNIDSGDVVQVSPDSQDSWSLLDTCNGTALATSSSPIRPWTLFLGHPSAPAAGMGKATWKWSDISPPPAPYAPEVESALAGLDFEVLQIPVPPAKPGSELAEGAKEPFEAIILRHVAKDTSPAPSPLPLVLLPHGGPHGSFVTSFVLSSAFLSALGFNILLVNFRGSTGFGEEALQSLPGNAGQQDVADCLAALDVAVAKGFADPARVAVVGGSHGGFLAAHLIGQAPDRFKTAVLRNPVCSIAGMIGVTDIPDWCFVETFGREGVARYSDNPTAEDFAALYQASPIAHVSKVKVPTLFMLGAQDRRVPISSGLQYVHALRSRGLESRVIMFPEDCHALDKPRTEFEQYANIGAWLRKHV